MTAAETLKLAQEELKQKQAALDAAQTTVDELMEQLNAAQRERDRLAGELELSAARLDEAWRTNRQATQAEVVPTTPPAV